MRPHKYRTGKTGRPVEGTPCKRCGHSKSDHTITHHVVMYSGGIGSFCAAERVKAKAGPFDTITLLFTDTKMEDEDLYRFLDETEKALGLPITKIADGRTPWEVFRDVRYLGNSRIDPCSKILKRELAIDWLKANKDPKDTICYPGIDWSEEHRYLRAKARHAELGWRYEAPMCEAPYLTKKDMLDRLSSYEIKPPRLYEMGFPHNNCGGFCVKAGKAHFKLLLEQLPERYKYHEEQEIASGSY